MEKRRVAAVAALTIIFSGAMATSNPAYTQSKKIALTFDDGPRPWVLKDMLPLFEKFNVPATFFVVGGDAASHPEMLREENRLGHEIENHSWGHENFVKLWREKKDIERVKRSLEKTDAVIFAATKKHPRFFRPPFWEINDEIEAVVKSLGYKAMKLDNPDINTMDYADYKKRPPEILVERVKRLIANREKYGKYEHVLVFHELPITTEALKTLIPYFQNQGYTFARLDQIIDIKK
jgi:peptidoglycan/xylan/chitin deacetylase (PgdA/CDA1 family)